jgi:hypothetical protein
MSHISKIDNAIIEHLIDAEPKGEAGYAVTGRSFSIIIAVSKALKMSYKRLPPQIRHTHPVPWAAQQKKNHSVAQSIRCSLRRLESDGIVTTVQARFTGEPEPDRNKKWCLTKTFASQLGLT